MFASLSIPEYPLRKAAFRLCSLISVASFIWHFWPPCMRDSGREWTARTMSCRYVLQAVLMNPLAGVQIPAFHPCQTWSKPFDLPGPTFLCSLRVQPPRTAAQMAPGSGLHAGSELPVVSFLPCPAPRRKARGHTITPTSQMW